MTREPVARVRAIVAKWPDVEEGTTFGFPAFKVAGKTFAWFPKKREVEPGTLAVRESLLARDHRVAAQPDVFYVTPHYQDYTAVLVRAELLSAGALRELLESACEFVQVQTKTRRQRRR